MRALEFTTTACCRPELVDKTYTSFQKNLLGVDWKQSTLYLNVDPLPSDKKQEYVKKIAQLFFGKVVSNEPDEANFCKALKWCWNQPKKDFFHLEDDWIMTRKVNIEDLFIILNGKKELDMVCLRAYAEISDNRICLSPALIRYDFAARSGRLESTKNPEQQLRTIKGKARQFPLNSRGIAIKDIGRKWMAGQHYELPSNDFNTWVSL